MATFSWVLCGFTPFTSVSNVCPKCKAAPTFDEVALLGGKKVLANVVAQNSDYYVVERFGELRMLKKSKVSAVAWRDEGPRKLATGDQILLKSGVVFHGGIASEQKGRFFVIQVGERNHMIWNSQIEAVYRGGNLYTLPVAPAAKPTAP
ncbi:MAG: hypothetical protein JRH20_00015 [Deltaproteobacteria bacterium]|nr:hypothetical protein [Deltaproteobacteria bacterium]